MGARKSHTKQRGLFKRPNRRLSLNMWLSATDRQLHVNSRSRLEVLLARSGPTQSSMATASVARVAAFQHLVGLY